MGNYDGSIKIDSKIDSKGFNKGINSMTASVKKIGLAIVAAFSIKAISSFVKESVNAASELSNAWTGLNSILEGQGKSFSNAKKFIEEYISDGLVAATEATTAYKNLSLRGYNEEQIQQVMTALKDSATFGRQSSYTLGEAVQTASEGLKNENSILVDNAGVTKNVAKMWEDYAKSVGKTTNNLTQAEKIQAEVNGILAETKFQAGDSAIYLNTYSGQLARLNASFTTLKQTVGNIFIPIFQALLPYINAVIQGLVKVAQTFAAVVQLIFGKTVDTTKKLANSTSSAASGISSMGNAAEKAGKQAKGALASFDDLEVLASDTSSGSTGSSAGSSGIKDIDLSGLDTSASQLTVISEEVQRMAENILNFFAPLKEISFDNLVNSAKDLLDAIKPFTKTIFEGLYWAYKNIFVPLAKWTIEDLLPAFLDLVAGAIKVLNPIVKAFMKAGKWLLENFLLPIAKWTGGVIIKVLKNLGNVLSKLGDTISKNKTAMAILEGIAKGILAIVAAYGIFKTAWTIGTILQSGIVAFQTAKLQASLFAMTIRTLGADVATSSGMLTVFQTLVGLITGKITLAQVATALWSKAQAAFNAVLHANPIRCYNSSCSSTDSRHHWVSKLD